MFDLDFENFWPRSSRESYLHENGLQFLYELEKFQGERKDLIDQILIRDEMINDLKLELREEHETFQIRENQLQEERIFRDMKQQEFDMKYQREELLKVYSTFESKTLQLKTDISKLTQQNEELSSQLEEMKKINLDNDYKKQNYQLNIEVMEKNLEMLQSSCDTITAQRDMAEDNLTKFSHNAQKNKKNYELCIESLKNELCTKTNDLINSLEEKDDLLEETSNQKKIIYNLKSKLQHEHEKFQQLEERNLECMERKEATFKQLHEDMNYDNLEYKDKNIKLEIEITILIDNNSNLVSQLNEEKSRFKIKEVEAIANKVLSKGVEENLQSKILKNKEILFLARQRGEALAKLKVKPLFCNQAIEGCLIKYFEVKFNKFTIFSTWRHHYLPNFKLKNETMSNLLKVDKQEPKLLKKIVLKRTMDFNMWKRKTFATQKSIVKTKISAFLYENFHSNLEGVKEILYSQTFNLKINKIIMDLKTSMTCLIDNCTTILNIGGLRFTKSYEGCFPNIKQSMCAMNSKYYHILFSSNIIASNGSLKNLFLQVSSNEKIWDPGIFERKEIHALNKIKI